MASNPVLFTLLSKRLRLFERTRLTIQSLRAQETKDQNRRTYLLTTKKTLNLQARDDLAHLNHMREKDNERHKLAKCTHRNIRQGVKNNLNILQ